jgi:uncharacterized membrane protein
MTLSGRSAIAVLAALGLSVAINFVAIGFFASHWMSRPDRGMTAERIVSLGARSLPPELRASIATELEPHNGDLRNAMRQIRDARTALFAAMRAEPFDADAVKSAFATLRDKLDGAAAIGQDAILGALQNASPQTRAAIVPPPSPPVKPRPSP